MSDYSSTKPQITYNYPSKAAKDGVSGFSRVEPFMTPERLRKEFLFGIPLVSFLTGERMTDETLKSVIARAAAEVEVKCKIDIFPVQRIIKQDFDYTKYSQGFNQMNLGFGPLKSLEEVSIRLINSTTIIGGVSNQADPEGTLIYRFPLEWVNLSYGYKGLLYFTPLQTVYSGANMSGIHSAGIGEGGAVALMTALNRVRNFPSFWTVKATFGFEEGSIPSPINSLIGFTAALEILSLLGITNWINGKSISIDGASQSLSGPGPQIFLARINDLKEKQRDLIDLVKKRFTANGIFMQHI